MDWNSDLGQKLAKRLRDEQVIWLTTVRQNGAPLPTPVWFVWDSESFLVYTQPGSAKLKHIAANPHVSFNLNSDEWGGSVAVFTGDITVQEDEPPSYENAAYVEKYQHGIKDLGMTPESFAAEYSVALRMWPKHIRAE